MAATTDIWVEILREAINREVEARKAAVPGAKFRQIVAKIATEKGLEYPPKESPGLKFASFLEQHPGIVALRKQPGADVLVAPADRPELLVEVPTPHQPLPSIRQDLFEAFTRIRSDKHPWYDKARDVVEWLPTTSKPEGDQFVKIPTPSIEALRAARKKFAAEQSDATLCATLEKAADNPAGLGAFSAVVREAGLGSAWHQFRIRLLVDVIGSWATRAGVSWNDAWLTAGRYSKHESTANANYESRDWRRILSVLVQTLEQEDLSRISVPLDLVAKILQQRR